MEWPDTRRIYFIRVARNFCLAVYVLHPRIRLDAFTGGVRSSVLAEGTLQTRHGADGIAGYRYQTNRIKVSIVKPNRNSERGARTTDDCFLLLFSSALMPDVLGQRQ